jgi:subtilisin family serine protease
MAPEADLVVVRSNLITPLVLDGIRYVFERADALGEPAAVNLSLGSHVGAHDGTTAFDLGIDALVGPGHVVVAAAGNENDLGWHARTRPAQGEVGYFTIEVDSHQADDRMPDVLAVAAYTPAAGQYTVTLRSPNGATAVAAPGQPGEYIGGDGMFMVDNGFLSEPNELNGLTTVLIAIVGSPLAPGANRNLIPPGTWTIEIAGDVVPAPADVHAWVMQSLMGGSAGCCASFGVSREDGTMVASPASAMRVIAVGAYMTKLNWTNPDGTGSGYGGDHAEGDLAFFSCVGPTRDGRIKPEIAAPGFGVAAAMSEGSSIAADYASHIVEDGVHIVLQGTSMAAPHGTGAAALLLSQFPHATPEDVRALIRRGGRADAFVGEAPNPRWGWGKLDVYTSLVGPTDDDDTGPGDDDVADDDADDGADAGADDDDGACCG